MAPILLLPSLRDNRHPHPNIHSGLEPTTSARRYLVTWKGPLDLSGGDKCAALPCGAWEGEGPIKRISKGLVGVIIKGLEKGLGTLRGAISCRHLRNDKNRSWPREVGEATSDPHQDTPGVISSGME